MQIKISRNALVLFLSLYFVCALNVSFWNETLKIIELDNFSDFIYLASVFVSLISIFAIFFNLILFRYIEKVLVIILVLISVFASYHMHYFKVVIDAEMIQNVLQTNMQESMELISFNLGFWFFVFGTPLVSLYFLNVTYSPGVLAEIKSRLITITIFALVIIFSVAISYKNIVVIHRNNKSIIKLVTPINCIYYFVKVVGQNTKSAKVITPIGLDATKGNHWQNVTKKSVLLIVLGEAARSSNFSLNGYNRETNPLLKTKNVISLKNVTSCGTCTAVSVPGIFSRLPRKNYTPEKAAVEENLLDILSRVNFSILWRDNNSSSKGVSSRFKEENIKHLNQYDEALLDGLDEYIKNIKGDAIIVLHPLGSHGPAYYKRYPNQFNKFTPTCNTNEIQTCKTSDLVNTYDNTILYTDYILAKAIELLEKNDNLNTAMLYVADHGQSLGEYGLYLHGTPYLIAPKEQIHIPWIIWLSDSFIKEFGVDVNSLRTKAEIGQYSHDNFFHSILGLLDIKTQEYEPKLDIFKK